MVCASSLTNREGAHKGEKMSRVTTKKERTLYIKRVTFNAKRLGLTINQINDILAENKVSFLGVIVEIMENKPNMKMVEKVIEQGETMNYAETLLGDWVYAATPNLNTFKEALKIYKEISKIELN